MDVSLRLDRTLQSTTCGVLHCACHGMQRAGQTHLQIHIGARCQQRADRIIRVRDDLLPLADAVPVDGMQRFGGHFQCKRRRIQLV